MTLLVHDRSFYKRAFNIAIPVTLQMIITISINLMDTVMLGSFGEIPVSASSLANQYSNIFHFICMGTGCGAAVMTARFWGSGDLPSLKKVISLTLWVSLAVSALFTVLAVLYPAQIMRVYTPDERVIASGVKYFTFLSWSYLFHAISVAITQILRSVGTSHIQMESSIIAFFVNVFFNWIFIFGKLGAPRLEIMGAAIGTLISRVVEAAYIAGHLLFWDKKIRYRLRDLLTPSADLLRPYGRFCLPVIGSDLLAGFGDNVLSMIMGRISANFVAANAITMMMVRLCTAMSAGLSNAAANITGNTLGKGEIREAQAQGRTLVILSGCVGLIGGGVILLLRNPILSMYDITPETHYIARQLMLAIAVILAFRSMGNTLSKGVLRGGGDTHFLLLGDVLFLWIVSIPLGYVAAFYWDIGPFWLYICFRVEFILKCIFCYWRFHSGKWIKKI